MSLRVATPVAGELSHSQIRKPFCSRLVSLVVNIVLPIFIGLLYLHCAGTLLLKGVVSWGLKETIGFVFATGFSFVVFNKPKQPTEAAKAQRVTPIVAALPVASPVKSSAGASGGMPSPIVLRTPAANIDPTVRVLNFTPTPEPAGSRATPPISVTPLRPNVGSPHIDLATPNKILGSASVGANLSPIFEAERSADERATPPGATAAATTTPAGRTPDAPPVNDEDTDDEVLVAPHGDGAEAALIQKNFTIAKKTHRNAVNKRLEATRKRIDAFFMAPGESPTNAASEAQTKTEAYVFKSLSDADLAKNLKEWIAKENIEALKGYTEGAKKKKITNTLADAQVIDLLEQAVRTNSVIIQLLMEPFGKIFKVSEDALGKAFLEVAQAQIKALAVKKDQVNEYIELACNFDALCRHMPMAPHDDDRSVVALMDLYAFRKVIFERWQLNKNNDRLNTECGAADSMFNSMMALIVKKNVEAFKARLQEIGVDGAINIKDKSNLDYQRFAKEVLPVLEAFQTKPAKKTKK